MNALLDLTPALLVSALSLYAFRRGVELYGALNEKLGLAALLPVWKEQTNLFYLTRPNENGVLPQDSTYLTLRDIDLTKYKQQAHVGGIYKDYNQDQITKIQVSKQADVMVLFYLLEEQFSREVKLASWSYYEPRCLHDSSLSLSTHSVLACDIGDPELGYEMFRKACLIDLDNANPHSSDAGIHAASYGGLWQCAVYGFGGLRLVGGKLRISPALPAAWDRLHYAFMWHGRRLDVTVTKDQVRILCEEDGAPVEVEVWGQTYGVNGELSVKRDDP